MHTTTARQITRSGRSRGQVAILLVGALPVLMGVAALATDVGTFYLNYYKLQTAADSAVLSGANYLPDYPSQAVSTADSYATTNGVQNSEITSTTVANSNSTLTIAFRRTVPTYLARALGLGNATIQVNATAQIASVGSASGLVPLGIDYRTQYTYGQTALIHQGQVGPGNWGALDLGGTGTANYVSNIENGYSGLIAINDSVTTDPGKDPSNTQQAIDYRLAQAQQMFPSGTFADHSLNDPRVMLVPMVDFSNINGSSQVPVKGFAQVWIVSVDSQGTITTYFIEQTASSSQPNPNIQGYGAYSTVLVN